MIPQLLRESWSKRATCIERSYSRIKEKHILTGQEFWEAVVLTEVSSIERELTWRKRRVPTLGTRSIIVIKRRD